VFSQDNIHTNGDLRVPVMLPVACRPVSAVPCFLVYALAYNGCGNCTNIALYDTAGVVAG